MNIPITEVSPPIKNATVTTVYHGTGNVSILGLTIQEILPYRFKKMESLEAFTWTSNTWKPETLP